MRVLILGGAGCVWDDVEESERLLGPEWWDVVIAANDIGCHWPRRLDYWVSLHQKKLPGWVEERAENGHPTGAVTVEKRRKNQGKKVADMIVRHPYDGGSSGLLAVSLALHLGAERVVLCGVPMDKLPHFEESTVHMKGRNWNGTGHRKKWRENAGDFVGIVKSMSVVYDPKTKEYRPGFTRQLLGAPTREWMEGTDEEAA